MEQLEAIFSHPKIPLLICLVGVVLIIGGLFSSGLTSTLSAKTPTVFPKESLISKDQISQIEVDIAGAVVNPGVYSLNSGSRMEDLIKVAGGFNSNVNQQFISKQFNLSQKISDGQKVYIPFASEQGITITTAAVTGAATTGGLIGINSGSADQLDSLPGIGPVTAQKIIAGRPYNSVDDLSTKKIVSKSVFTKIKDLVDLN